jgi:succinate dehydrogenase / fumarate reductase, flavoprotein subunit
MTYGTIEAPVLIIGAGAAGLRAAIELRSRGVDCLVLGKRAHGDAHTRWAAGGINASLGTRDAADSWQRHFADTIREGHFVCDPQAVELLCRDAPERIHELRAWGCAFNETADGRLDQRYFGAQTFRRTCFVGDRTGEAILDALVQRARDLEVPWREHIYIFRILTTDGRAAGALGLDLETGARIVFRSDVVVLAAGGCTSVYQRSTSRSDENNGDAAALAYDAGAVLRDMEFVQFHPTGMVEPAELRGRLVTEAVRGEGGRLYNAGGERFMERYSPARLELDARDVVARSIFREIREGRGTPAGAVLLDVSHHDDQFIQERLPKVAASFAEHGVDISRQPMQVAPTAHYAMGGVRVDFDTGATTVPGLFAVGEATAGLHGANRLGGNSLAETVVFGRRTGAYLAKRASRLPAVRVDEGQVHAGLAALERVMGGDGKYDSLSLAAELGTLLWEHAGIIRNQRELEDGLERLTDLQQRARSVGCDAADSGPHDGSGTGPDGSPDGSPAGSTDPRCVSALNLRFMLHTAEAVLRGALLREESRGAHFRDDHPESKAEWERSILCGRAPDGRMRLRTEAIPAIPPELEAVVREDVEPDYHHLE